MIPRVMVREGSYAGYSWRQYFVVTDNRVAVVHMTPAMFGWNIGRIDVQSGDDWCGMSRDQIIAWKERSDDGITGFDPDLGDFRATLLARAGV